MDCVDSLVVQVDYEDAPDTLKAPEDMTGWLVEGVSNGSYPMQDDGFPFQGFVRCRDQNGCIVRCSTDLDFESVLVFEREVDLSGNSEG
ncbi:hypothetical protein [Neptuniibacter halophilus]|uniref:hypothetical protein n=1 Tax=Neptuniibacter halophilus TaxID=651666 RepID=UPI002572C8B9|nr:hypothetical protein [Neptuniibacter halophilus]